MLAVVVYSIRVIGTKVPGTRRILYYEQLVARKKSRKSPTRELGYISTSYEDNHPPRKSCFAALLDCVPGILLLLMLLLLLFAFINLALMFFVFAVVYTIRVIGTRVPGTRCVLHY